MILLISRLIIFLTGAAVLLAMLLAGVWLAAIGTFGRLHLRHDAQVLSRIESISTVFLGGLVLLAIPTMLNVWIRPEDRRRIGARQVLAGLPDLSIAWTYVAALAAPALIGSGTAELLEYMLGVEVIAAYTAVMVAALRESIVEKPGEFRLLFPALIVCSLVIVGAMSFKAGSFLLFLGYVILTAKRFAADRFDPERTAGSVKAHQRNRCMATLCMFCFIGLPLFILFEDSGIVLVLGAFYFVAMALLEMLMSAPRAGAVAAARQPAPG